MNRGMLLSAPHVLLRNSVAWMVQRAQKTEKEKLFSQLQTVSTKGRSMEMMNDGSILKKITFLLIQADKLVKEGDLDGALAKITEAREFDPQHLYAIAYEERVKALLHSKKRMDMQSSKPVQRREEQSIARAARREQVHHSPPTTEPAERADTALLPGPACMEGGGNGKPSSTTDNEIRTTAERTDIVDLLMHAQRAIDRKEYNRALDDIARVYLHAPDHAPARILEQKVRKAISQQTVGSGSATERTSASNGTTVHHEGLKTSDGQTKEESKVNGIAPSIDNPESRKEYAKHHGDCFRRVGHLLHLNKLEEALTELARAVIIDPFNEELIRLEKSIIDVQHRQLEERRRCCKEIAEMII